VPQAYDRHRLGCTSQGTLQARTPTRPLRVVLNRLDLISEPIIWIRPLCLALLKRRKLLFEPSLDALVGIRVSHTLRLVFEFTRQISGHKLNTRNSQLELV
ncbi:hypothetical protein Tco_1036343, partial [Tanacetum coccineum]